MDVYIIFVITVVFFCIVYLIRNDRVYNASIRLLRIVRDQNKQLIKDRTYSSIRVLKSYDIIEDNFPYTKTVLNIFVSIKKREEKTLQKINAMQVKKNDKK